LLFDEFYCNECKEILKFEELLIDGKGFVKCPFCKSYEIKSLISLLGEIKSSLEKKAGSRHT